MSFPPVPARLRSWALPALLLAAHGLAALDAARRLSPAWDEIIYPAVGWTQWKTRSLSINTTHNFLSKLVSAAPFFALDPDIPFSHKSWEEKEDFRFGFQFTFRNRVPAEKLIFWGRVPSVLFSLMTGLLLFLWTRSLWGVAGGTVALLCYCATPILLSRAGTALMEMPMYFFILSSFRLYAKRLESGRVPWLAAAGAAAGLAFLCKESSLPAIAALAAAELLLPRDAPARRALNAALLLSVACAVAVLGYLPWQGAWEAMRTMASFVFDFTRKDYNSFYYWNGEVFSNAPSLITWGAFFVKAPPFVLALCAWGAVRAYRDKERRQVWMLLTLPAAAYWLSVFLVRDAMSTVQLSPLYLGLIPLSAALGPVARGAAGKKRAVVLSALLAAAVVDAGLSHPNQLGYFNLLAGGPSRGHRWLGDSDQDWGQSLPALARHVRERGNPGLILAYSGAGDPAAYGLRYQDLASPALVSADYRAKDAPLLPLDQDDVLLAVSAKVMQSEPLFFTWPRENLTPANLVQSNFFVYDIGRNPEAHRWMGHVYLRLRRPREARWAFQRARRLDPGHETDERILSALKEIP